MEKLDSMNLDELVNDFLDEKIKYVPRFCFPEMRIKGDNFFFLISTIKEHGLLGKLTDKLISSGFELSSIQMEKLNDEFLLYLLLYATSSDGNQESMLIDVLNQIDVLKKFKVKRLSEIERNPFTYPISFCKGNRRALNLDRGLFKAMYRTIPNGLGSGGDYLMYMSGVSTADYIWNSFPFDGQEDIEEQFLLLEDIFRTIGFGIILFENIDPLKSEGKIIIYDSMEAFLSDSCAFMKGFLTEMLKHILEDPNIDVCETSCLSKGDPSCVFELNRNKLL